MLLSACGSQSQQAAVTGYAYTGPSTLELFSELGLNAPVAAIANHGERVQIIDTRRRFVRVRTKDGAEGWTDSSYLLTQSEIDDLNELAEVAAHRPAQGAATVLDKLNVHTAPSRAAQSFAQLEPGDRMQIIAHRVTPRDGSSRPVAKVIPVAPAPAPAELDEVAAKPLPEPDPLTPPPPPPPPPPADFEKLSRPRLEDLPGYRASNRARPASDDWFLVRTPDGKAGWVLMRMVFMNIPDEVGQYAEGNFITSYHRLGEVVDPATGEVKQNWLWTTASSSLQQQDFDSVRVFYYNTRRHRYETAYIERRMRGYYPVETFDLEERKGMGFSLVVKDDDGKLNKQSYLFDGVRVRRLSTDAFQEQAPLPEVRVSDVFDAGPPPDAEPGWGERVRKFTKQWFGL